MIYKNLLTKDLKNEKSFEELLMPYDNVPKGKNSSIHSSIVRINKAEEQARLVPVEIKEIITYTNEFLKILGMSPIENPIIDLVRSKLDYKQIKNESGANDERDIVWMKFTQDNYLGVVAASSDVNFNIPTSKDDYNIKKNGKWVYNTSGIIIHHLNKKWNKDFVLIFPLVNIPQGLQRGDIERGIGNYLISNQVPILDFYSHNY